ncbi:lipin 3 [Aphelenchoides avenae]|nr:lipin 3 [Aphelenchus avenae]
MLQDDEAERAKATKRQHRTEQRAQYEQKRLTSNRSTSRSPSPSVPKKTPASASTAHKKGKPSTSPSLATKTLDPKKRIPYSSSIFSCRRNRSLPDLSTLTQSVGTPTSTTPKKKGHSRQHTLGQIDRNVLDQHESDVTQLSHSKSALLNKRSFSPPARTDRTQADLSGKESMERLKAVRFTHEELSDGESTCSSRTGSHDDLRSAEHLDGSKQSGASSSAAYDIADGALSDSEVDRHRNSPDTKNEPEWKWGELPQTKKDASAKGQEANQQKKTGWSWFRWGTSKKDEQEEQGMYLGDLVENTTDPSKREKYLGKGVGSTTSNLDSGNGVSLGTTPASPSALSVESLTDDVTQPDTDERDENDSTPSGQDALSKEEIAKALKKADAVEKEMLAGTDEHDSTPTTATGAKVAAEEKLDKGSTPSTSATPAEAAAVVQEEAAKRRHKSERSGTSTSHESGLSDEETVQLPTGRRFKRSLRLSSERLKRFGLRYGSNEVRFSVTTKFQGTAWCSCHIYLLKWSERLVISDVDGTITRSDVLGHVIPAIGGTWAHAGVAELYTRIKNNGYRMVYLSSRAIGQSHYTKTYLQSIAQGSKMLPDGPVLLSPTSVLMAFRKEVIERKPEEFKIACLTDLKALFPVRQPFYAGFGNRETDVKSYLAVGIPAERILIINPAGKVRRADKIGYVSSYATMATETVDYLFPPLVEPPSVALVTMPDNDEVERLRKEAKPKTNFSKPERFRQDEFTFWQTRPNEFDPMVQDELELYERRRKSVHEEAKKPKKPKK